MSSDSIVGPEDGPIELRLPASADIRQAADLRASCLDAMAGDGDVVLDASAVERIDTAAFQVVVALRGDLGRQGRRLLVSEPSGRFDQVATALGLEELLR